MDKTKEARATKKDIRQELDELRASDNDINTSVGVNGKPQVSTVNGWTVEKYASGLRIAKLVVTQAISITQSLPIPSVVDNHESGATVSATSLLTIGSAFGETLPAGVFTQEPHSISVQWRLTSGKDDNIILFNSVSEVYNKTTIGKHRPIIMRMLESTPLPEQLLMDIVVIGY